MFISKIYINQFKVLRDIEINFDETTNNLVFPVIGINGGGKSSLIQTIFTFLHCPFQENRFEYIQNLLRGLEIGAVDETVSKIIAFEITSENKPIELSFYSVGKNYKGLNFDAVLALKELKQKKVINEELTENIDVLDRLERDIMYANISDSLIKRELRRFLNSSQDEHNLLTATNKTAYVQIIKDLRKRFVADVINADELNLLIFKAEKDIEKLYDSLKEDGLNYALHFKENENILLYSTNVEKDILVHISNKIYLASPNTQVLHFLHAEKLKALFKNEKYLYSSYEYHIKQAQTDLVGLFTYDFSIIQLIIEAFQKARDEDFAQALSTGTYGNQINKTHSEMNSLLTNKTIAIDKDLKSISFKSIDGKLEYNSSDLSHGELKKLSIYIWIKAKTAQSSVILMDEVDIGLHPTWQADLTKDLQEWGQESQFLLATHSPSIIGNVPFRNLVVLSKKNDICSKVEQYEEAPLGSDLNTIVKTIMGGEYISDNLRALHNKYRTFVEKKDLDSAEAQRVKAEILEYESENSAFFQEIKFEIEFGK